MRKIRTSLVGLVDGAIANGLAEASDGRWRAWSEGDGRARRIVVAHHGTAMVAVTVDGHIVPISGGIGSMSDKCGIRKVLQRHGGKGYADIYS